MKTERSVWTDIWSQSFDEREQREDIERERQSVRWLKLRDRILAKHGSFDSVKTIEIGAGRGIYSLLMSLEGAEATVLDNNEGALQQSEQFFSFWKRPFQGVCADAFDLPEHLKGKFDIAMSYGLAEHFEYPKRFDVFRAHAELLKPGGLLMVSVPNAAFAPYRIGKFLLEKMNKWMLGLEIPFSRGELIRTGKSLGLSNQAVVGSDTVGDFLNFWFVQRGIHLVPYVWDQGVWKLGFKKENVTPLKDRFHYFSLHPRLPVDDYLGYALVLVGEV